MSDQSGVEATPAESAPEATTAPTETPGTTGPDFGPIMERFDALEQRYEQSQQVAEPEPEPADPYASLSDLGYSDEESQATQQALDAIFEAKMAQSVGPLQQELQRLRSELDYGDLEERFPALQTPEGSEKAMGESRQAASDIARALGLDPGMAQQLAMSPKLIEMAHLAGLGRERASQERPAGQPGAELEQPGGASPPEPEPDVNDQILSRSGPKNFWG